MKAWKMFMVLLDVVVFIAVLSVALIFFWRAFTGKTLTSGDVYWAMAMLLIRAYVDKEKA